MDRKQLVATLSLTGRALTKTDMVPIYKCFAFSGETVLAYDGQIGVMAPCKTDETYAIDGKTLLGLLEASNVETVDIALQGHDAIIKAGRSTFKLPFYPFEDFLFQTPEDQWDLTLKLDADFKLGLEACLETSSRNTAQEAFMGVYVTPGPKGVMYSSDGDAISEYKLDAKLKGTQSFMLPNAFCESLLALFTEFEGASGTLRLNDEWAQAELADGYVVYGNMLKNDNPIDFANQIKKTTKGAIDFHAVPAGLDNALSRARVVADPESAKTALTVEKGRLRLVTETSMGTVRDTLPFAEHPEVEVNINAALMQRSLAHCPLISISENYCAFTSSKLLVITGNMD